MLSESPSSDRVCLKLAQILRVRRSEVALLRLEKGSLRFIFPPELRSAGVLPLTGSAVAARTAATRTPLLSNTFMRVKHVSLFEAVKLGAEADEEDRSQEQMPIQKIMSVPVMNSGANVMGVVQVSRKGLDASRSGRRLHRRRLEATGAGRGNSRPHALHAGRRGDLGARQLVAAIPLGSRSPHNSLSGAESRRPCPLEVKPAQLAGDIDHFSNEKKSRHFLRFHRLGGKFVGIDATRGDFRFSVTLGSFRIDFPSMQLMFGVSEGAIGVAR